MSFMLVNSGTSKKYTMKQLFDPRLFLCQLLMCIIAPVNQLIAQQSCQVVFTIPEKNLIEVGMNLRTEGTASIPDGCSLWILVTTEGFEDVWWPQNEARIDPTTGIWHVLVTFGGPQDIGKEFKIAAIVVSQQEHTKLKDYRTKAMQSGDWMPIVMPPTVCAPKMMSVIKVSH
jgi:hypothetical protein